MASIAENRIPGRSGIDMAAASIAIMLGLGALLMLYYGYSDFSPGVLLASAGMLTAALTLGLQGYRRAKENDTASSHVMHALAEASAYPVTIRNAEGEIVFANSAAQKATSGNEASTPALTRLPWRAADGRLLGWIEMVTGDDKYTLAQSASVQALSELDLEGLVVQRTAEVRELVAHIEACREEEKKAVARKLHGELGASLTALSMHLAILSKQTPDIASLHERLKQMKEVLGAAGDTTRKIQSGLRPDKLDLFGMKVAIEDLTDAFSQSTGIACILQVPEELRSLPEHLEIALYRMLEEALRNVTQHAYATEVDIVVEERDDKVKLIVRDNGVGFSPHDVPAATHGLCGLRERAAYLGGTAVIESAPGKGAQVSITLPVLMHADALALQPAA